MQVENEFQKQTHRLVQKEFWIFLESKTPNLEDTICGMNVKTEEVRKNHERSCIDGKTGWERRREHGMCVK